MSNEYFSPYPAKLTFFISVAHALFCIVLLYGTVKCIHTKIHTKI